MSQANIEYRMARCHQAEMRHLRELDRKRRVADDSSHARVMSWPVAAVACMAIAILVAMAWLII